MVFLQFCQVVGTQKPCKERIIHPAIHVDQTKLRQMFVPCKATVKQGGAYIEVVPVARISSSAPGVVAQAFNKVARGIADGGEAAGAVVDRKTVSTCHACGCFAGVKVRGILDLLEKKSPGEPRLSFII